MSERIFTRAPRKPVGRLPSDAFAFIVKLAHDPRFARLLPSHRDALMRAAILYAGGDGRFWPTVDTWADECETSASTIERAIRGAEAVGLLRREPYLRPDGKQGSTTYVFDPTLLPKGPVTGDGAPSPSTETRSVTGDVACAASGRKNLSVIDDGQTRAFTADGPTSSVATDGPEQKVEQKKEQKEGLVLDRNARPCGLVIEDDCLICQRRTKHVDDGHQCVCLVCDEQSGAKVQPPRRRVATAATEDAQEDIQEDAQTGRACDQVPDETDLYTAAPGTSDALFEALAETVPNLECTLP